MEYAEKLRSPLWQRRRLDILKRDDFTCQLCFDTTTELQIHHKYYTPGAEVWEYPDEALICYCKHCHAVVECVKEKYDSVPLVLTKKENTEMGHVRILGIIRSSDNQKVLFIGAYSNNKFRFMVGVTEETCRDLIELIELSEKL